MECSDISVSYDLNTHELEIRVALPWGVVDDSGHVKLDETLEELKEMGCDADELEKKYGVKFRVEVEWL